MKYIILTCFMIILFSTMNAQKNTLNTIYDIEINNLEGQPIILSDYKGKKILIVNVASECGFTGQYEDLQKLYNQYSDKLMIIGVPCNQFGGQEPGNANEIKSFCELNYGVTFLMTEKVDVKGNNQHPLYQWLTSKELNGLKNSSVKWNFQKYLINENGEFIDYYLSMTKPLNKKITNHIIQ